MLRKLKLEAVLLLLLLIALFAGGGYLLYATGVIDLFVDKDRLLETIERYHTYAVLIFIGLQAVQVIAAPIPGEVTGIAGGILFGAEWGIVYSTIGLTLGSWVAFMMARLMGRPLVETLVSKETMRRYDYVMKHKGLFLAFMLFLVPGFPKDFLCYIFGLGHMRQRDFLLVSTTGRLLGTVLLTLGGTYLREERWYALSVVVGLSLAIALLTMVFRRRIERAIRRVRALQRLRAMIQGRRAQAPDRRTAHAQSNYRYSQPRHHRRAP